MFAALPKATEPYSNKLELTESENTLEHLESRELPEIIKYLDAWFEKANE